MKGEKTLSIYLHEGHWNNRVEEKAALSDEPRVKAPSLLYLGNQKNHENSRARRFF